MILFILAILVLAAGVVMFVGGKDENPAAAKAVVAGALVISLVLGGVSCAVNVPTVHTGIITTFGRVEDKTLDAGISFKLPWQRVIKMDNRMQKQTVELFCFSADIQEVSMVYTVNYQIDKENAQNIYRNIGVNYYNTAVAPCITEAVKIVTAQYTAEELVANRSSLAIAIEEELAEKLMQYDVELVSTSIEDMDFTDAFTNAVEEKQIATQNKLTAETNAETARIEAQAAADIKVIEAEAEADALLIRAEAEAEANEKIAASLTDSVLQKMYYETWNGELPTVYGSDGNLIQMPVE
jgi:regulator of protease activity HflC (stomatin/prohibitin superfamily)